VQPSMRRTVRRSRAEYPATTRAARARSRAKDGAYGDRNQESATAQDGGPIDSPPQDVADAGSGWFTIQTSDRSRTPDPKWLIRSMCGAATSPKRAIARSRSSRARTRVELASDIRGALRGRDPPPRREDRKSNRAAGPEARGWPAGIAESSCQRATGARPRHARPQLFDELGYTRRSAPEPNRILPVASRLATRCRRA